MRKDKNGKPIPDAAFENEPPPPGDPTAHYSKENLAEFDRNTARLKAEAEKLRKKS